MSTARRVILKGMMNALRFKSSLGEQIELLTRYEGTKVESWWVNNSQ